MDKIVVNKDDLIAIKNKASELCGISDNVAHLFGEEDEIPRCIDKIEHFINTKITEMLNNN